MHNLGNQIHFLPGILVTPRAKRKKVILVSHEVSNRLTCILPLIKTRLKYCFQHCHAVNENTSLFLFWGFFFPLNN